MAPELGGANRVALSNLWLFEPLVRRQLETSPGSAAMLCTTTALIVMHAGEKVSVLPGRADAQVNFRLRPGVERSAAQTRLAYMPWRHAWDVHKSFAGW